MPRVRDGDAPAAAQRDVETRYGGKFVQCIGELCGESGAARSTGSTSSTAARRARARPTTQGPRRRPRLVGPAPTGAATQRIPAVVGSFPEPFVHGPGTPKRLPVRVECVELESDGLRAGARRARDVRRAGGAGHAAALDHLRDAARARRPLGGAARRQRARADGERARRERRLRRAARRRAQHRAARRRRARRCERWRAAAASSPRRPPATTRRSGRSPAPTTPACSPRRGRSESMACANRFARRGRRRAAQRPAAHRGAGAVIYTPRASPLHAARAGVALAYGAALIALALAFEHPAVLAARRGRRAGRRGALRRRARRSRGSPASRCRWRC